MGYIGSPVFANTTITNVMTVATSVLSKTCTLAAGLNVLRVTGLQTDGVAMTGTLRGAYIDVSNGSTAATGTIRGMELKARTEAPGDTGNDVTTLEGLSISADSKGHSVTTMRAAEFILDGSAGGTIDEAVGLRIANNLQADKATVSYGLQIYRDSFDYTYDISLSLGGHITGDSYVNQDVRTTASPIFVGLTLSGIAAEATDVDKFLVDSTGVIKYRTGIQVLSDIGGQASDAGLTSLAGLVYASDSFIKATAADTYVIRTIAETKTDLSLNLVENTTLSTWAGTTNIVTLGTITNGVFTVALAIPPDGGRVANFSTGSDNIWINFQAGTAQCLFFADRDTDGGVGTGSAHPFYIRTTNVNRITLDADGTNCMFTSKVGVGVTPVTKFTVEGTITLKEQASADGDTAAYGQIWIKTATPNELWFTSDDGVDHQIAFV